VSSPIDPQPPLDPALAPQPAGPELPGPFAVGRYAGELRDFLRARARVLVIGELTGFKRARVTSYFELRDADGAVPCSMWNTDLDKLGLDEAVLKAGAEVVVAGGPDYYPGSATASPSFSFRVTHMRLAGEGDLMAQLRRLRLALEKEGLFEPQKQLPRPLIPKTIGVVSARRSAAAADLLAGLERRGWRGTLVWADAPVQDRRAAPAIARALRDLAAVPEVEVAVVCRGGGSLFDLWAFCDEALCRTVSMLRLPVISAVGHESDRTLIDDVSAVCCSTPTHAVDELVRVNVGEARASLIADARLTRRASAKAVDRRARRLIDLARSPERTVRAERARLHQMLREIRASSARRVAERAALAGTHGLVVRRRAAATAIAVGSATRIVTGFSGGIDRVSRRLMETHRIKVGAIDRTLRAHDPQRTLERGYALVEDAGGDPVTSAEAARRQGELNVRFADDAVRARVENERND
jgi:exodeoxyribonuclease VII large subunit